MGTSRHVLQVFKTRALSLTGVNGGQFLQGVLRPIQKVLYSLRTPSMSETMTLFHAFLLVDDPIVQRGLSLMTTYVN